MKLLHNVRLHSGVCVGHAPLIQSQTSQEDKDEKTQENYSAPWCYHPAAELEVRDRTVLKTLGREERPFTILYTGSKLSISICPRHSALLKWLFFLNVSAVSFAVKTPWKQKASVTLNIIKAILLRRWRFPFFSLMVLKGPKYHI